MGDDGRRRLSAPSDLRTTCACIAPSASCGGNAPGPRGSGRGQRRDRRRRAARRQHRQQDARCGCCARRARMRASPRWCCASTVPVAARLASGTDLSRGGRDPRCGQARGGIDGRCGRVGRLLRGGTGQPHLRQRQHHHRIHRRVLDAADAGPHAGQGRRHGGRRGHHGAVGQACAWTGRWIRRCAITCSSP